MAMLLSNFYVLAERSCNWEAGDQKCALLGQRPEKQGHIWPCGGCNLAAVLLKTFVARIRSKMIRVISFFEVIIQFRLLCVYREAILRSKKGMALIPGR